MFTSLILGLWLVFGSTTLGAWAADGDVDTAFSAKLKPGFLFNEVDTVAVQSDGKILVGGRFMTPSRYLARLNPDGSVDTGFSATIGSSFDIAVNDVVLQPDGKILVGGNLNHLGHYTLARLNPDGTFDKEFNFPMLNEHVESVAVQSDGKIVVGGAFTFSISLDRIMRLNADGIPDTGFNKDFSFLFNNDVLSVAVQSDGKILAGGTFTASSPISSRFLARLNADGTVDTGFNTNVGSLFSDDVFSVAVQSDGKVLVGTYAGSVNGNMARLNGDGTVDTGFAGRIGTGFDDSVTSVVVQSDGKILVGGWFMSFNGVGASRLARLNVDGTVDTGFAGRIGTGFNGSVTSVVVQWDGKILTGGGFGSVNGVISLGLARLDNSLPTNPVT